MFCKFVVGAARFVVGAVHQFAPLGYGPGPKHYWFLPIFGGVIGSICPGNRLSWLRNFVIFFYLFGQISWSYFKLGKNLALCIPQYWMCCSIRLCKTRVTWRWIAYTVEEWHKRDMEVKMADLAETCRHECKTIKLDPGVTDDGSVQVHQVCGLCLASSTPQRTRRLGNCTCPPPLKRPGGSYSVRADSKSSSQEKGNIKN